MMNCKHCQKSIGDRETPNICDNCFAKHVWLKTKGGFD